MTKPIVRLTGEDGNVFAVIGACAKALRKSDTPELEKEFREKARNAKDYDEVLALAEEYCDVT